MKRRQADERAMASMALTALFGSLLILGIALAFTVHPRGIGEVFAVIGVVGNAVVSVRLSRINGARESQLRSQAAEHRAELQQAADEARD